MGPNQKHQHLHDSSAKWVTVLALLLTMVVPLFTGALLSWHSLGELDVWLHQKAGQEIFSGDGFSHLNTYSYTEPNHAWTNHEWFFQILVAATGPGSEDLLAGINRWVILRLALTILLLAILLAGDRPWRAPPRHLLWSAPGILLGVALLWPRILLRPELVSYTLMVLMVRLAESPTHNTWHWRQLLSLRSRETQAFAVTLLWAQFHGFSALAPFVWLLAGLVGYIPHSRFIRTSGKRLLTGTALLLLALLMTPNGWQGFIYPLQALGQFSESSVDLHTTISELQPLLETPDGFNLTILGFKLSLVWGVLLIVATWRQRNILRATLWVMAALSVLAAQRNLGFYAITFVLLHTDLNLLKNFDFFPEKLKFQSPRVLLILPVLIVLIATPLLWTSVITDGFYLGEGQSRRFGNGPSVARFPFKAAEILARIPETRVFANVDAASLTLSRGKALVFIDGRTEAYSPSTWQRYLQLRQAGPDAFQILDQSGTRNVLLTLGGGAFHPLLQALVQNPDWHIRYADPAGVLLSRPIKPSSRESSTLESFARLYTNETDSRLPSARQGDLYAAQANLLNLAGQSDLAEERLKLGLKVRPEHPLLNHNLGNQLMQKGRTVKALEHFQKALEVNPRLSGSAMNAGVCLMKIKDFRGAEEMFGKSCSLQPDNFQSWANRSLALQQLGQHQKAYNSMAEAVRLNPGNPRLRQALQNLQQKLR